MFCLVPVSATLKLILLDKWITREGKSQQNGKNKIFRYPPRQPIEIKNLFFLITLKLEFSKYAALLL